MEAVSAFLRRLWDSIKEYWQSQERKAKVRFVVISGVAIAGLVLAVVLLSRVSYVVLLDSSVSAADRKAARDALTALNIRTRASGDQLLVDSSQRDSAILELSGLEIPSDGYDYGFLDMASGFGVSETERKKLYQIQTQEILNKEIAQGPKIKSARVEVAQPDNTYALFGSELVPVTASVVLNLVEPLTTDEVNGVTNMVAHAISGLEADNIVVVDQYMNVLNRGAPTDMTAVTQQHDYELIVQSDLNRALLSVLQAMFGADYVRVATNVKIDFDDKSSEQVTLTPVDEDNIEGIKASQRRITEKATGGAAIQGEPGIDENGWDPSYVETGANTGATWSHVTEEINWEFNERIDRIAEAKGKLTDLTATIVIDDSKLEDSSQNVRDIQSIVGGIIGLLPSDYGRISVSLRPLQGIAEQKQLEADIQAELRWQNTLDLIRIIVLYLVIGGCIALLIHRVYKFFRPPTPEDELINVQAMADTEELDEYADLLKLTTTAEDIEAVKSPERMKIEDFIDRNPDMVANLLRNWLSEEVPRGRR